MLADTHRAKLPLTPPRAARGKAGAKRAAGPWPADAEPHTILGVRPSCGEREVRAAFKRLARRWHPDRGGDGAVMARIAAAKDSLLRQLSGHGSDSEDWAQWAEASSDEEERRAAEEQDARRRIEEMVQADADEEAERVAIAEATAEQEPAMEKRARGGAVQLDLFGGRVRDARPCAVQDEGLVDLPLLVATGEVEVGEALPPVNARESFDACQASPTSAAVRGTAPGEAQDAALADGEPGSELSQPV